MRMRLLFACALLLGACAGPCGGDAAPEAITPPSADAGNAADAGSAIAPPEAEAPTPTPEPAPEVAPEEALARAVVSGVQPQGVANAVVATERRRPGEPFVPPVVDLTGAREREMLGLERIIRGALERCAVLSADKVTVSTVRYGLAADNGTWEWSVIGEGVGSEEERCLLRALPAVTLDAEAPEAPIVVGALVIDGDDRPRRQLRFEVARMAVETP
jgi:hypothetical protein